MAASCCNAGLHAHDASCHTTFCNTAAGWGLHITWERACRCFKDRTTQHHMLCFCTTQPPSLHPREDAATQLLPQLPLSHSGRGAYCYNHQVGCMTAVSLASRPAMPLFFAPSLPHAFTREKLRTVVCSLSFILLQRFSFAPVVRV